MSDDNNNNSGIDDLFGQLNPSQESSTNSTDSAKDQQPQQPQSTKDNYYEEILEEESEAIKNAKPEVKQLFSEVAGNKKSKMLLSIILGLGVSYGAYQFIFADSEEEKLQAAKPKIDKSVEVKKLEKPVDEPALDPQIPVLPDITKMALPELPPGKEVKPTDLPPLPEINETKNDLSNNMLAVPNEAKAQRLKSNIALINGGKTPDADFEGTSAGPNAIPLTSKRVTATRIGDLRTIVGQGKMIDAILETSVNSDLPGMVRGMVSKDVFSEAGSNILIPKGSRLVGEYKSGVALGQQRIEINWTRLIRPDGIDINLQSASTDPLGNSGIQGIVDNKYLTMFTNSLLSSIVNIGVARWKDVRDKASGIKPTSSTPKILMQTVLDKNGNPVQTPVLDEKGNPKYYNEPQGEIKTPSATDDEVKKAGEDVGKIASDIVKKQIEAVKPTIVLHQGARVRVFVSTDLVFPSMGTAGVRVIK
jgi:type IV secretion system protein VirB10